MAFSSRGIKRSKGRTTTYGTSALRGKIHEDKVGLSRQWVESLNKWSFGKRTNDVVFGGMNGLWWFTRLRMMFFKDDIEQQLGLGEARAGQGQKHPNTFLMLESSPSRKPSSMPKLRSQAVLSKGRGGTEGGKVGEGSKG